MTEVDVERMIADCMIVGASADAVRKWCRPAQQLRQHYPVHELELNRASARLSAGMLLSVEEILAGARPYDDPSGVYFLILGSEVVYVGQSKRVMHRIEEHRTRFKFTRYAFAPFAQKHLDLVESLYIHLLRPRYNGMDMASGVRRPAAPIALERLLDMALAADEIAPAIEPLQRAEIACDVDSLRERA